MNRKLVWVSFSTTFPRCDPEERAELISHSGKHVSDDDEDSALPLPSGLNQGDCLWEYLSAERCWPVCVCVWRLCLAPSSPHSPSGKLRAGTILLFIPLSHTALAITIYRHAATGKVRVDLLVFISPWWHEWNALFCFNSVCCLIPDLLKRRTAVVASDEKRRPADKTQTGHKLRTMVLHITH